MATTGFNMTALTNTTNLNYTLTVNGVFIRPDGQWAYNMSRNNTIPWENPEAMGNLIQQWIRLENLPRSWEAVKIIAYLSLAILTLLLRYPLWQVLATMTIVEAPQTVLQTTPSRSEKKSDDDVDTTIISHERATSSSLRASTRHIYRIAGIASFYRGLANVLCLYGGGLPILTPIMFTIEKILSIVGISRESDIGNEIATSVAMLITNAVLITWDTAHTHVMITPPTLRVWYRRLPPFWKTLKLVLPCIFTEFLAVKITFDLPNLAMKYAGVKDKTAFLGPDAIGNAHLCRTVTLVAIWFAAQAARLGLLVPAGVAKIRVQTSLLPDDEETIVPIDRTFGTGRPENRPSYVPRGILATSPEPIGLRTALKTYNREEMKRILLMYAKFAGVELALLCLFWPVLGNDVWPDFWHPRNMI